MLREREFHNFLIYRIIRDNVYYIFTILAWWHIVWDVHAPPACIYHTR